MDAYQTYQKIQEAIKAVEEYEKEVKTGKRSLWDDDIKKGFQNLTEKRHMLAASGQICSACGGTGRR